MADSTRRPVIFLLPGLGDHYVGMGRDLYEKWGVFRNEVDRCAELLEPHLKVDLRKIIYPENFNEKRALGNNRIDLKRMLGHPADRLTDVEGAAA